MKLIVGEKYQIDTFGEIETVTYKRENTTPCLDQPKVYWGVLENGQSKSFYKSQVKA